MPASFKRLGGKSLALHCAVIDGIVWSKDFSSGRGTHNLCSWGTFPCKQHQVYTPFILWTSGHHRQVLFCLLPSLTSSDVSYTIKIRCSPMLQNFSKLACTSSWIKCLPGHTGCFSDWKSKIPSECHHSQSRVTASHEHSSYSHLTALSLTGQHARMLIALTPLRLAGICLYCLCFEDLEDAPLPSDSLAGKAVLDFRQKWKWLLFSVAKRQFATTMRIFSCVSSAQKTVISEGTNWFRMMLCSQPYSDMNASHWMFKCLTWFTPKPQSLSWIWF